MAGINYYKDEPWLQIRLTSVPVIWSQLPQKFLGFILRNAYRPDERTNVGQMILILIKASVASVAGALDSELLVVAVYSA